MGFQRHAQRTNNNNNAEEGVTMSDDQPLRLTTLKSPLQNSVTMIKNNKGYNWEIKYYFKEGEDEALIAKLVALNDALKKQYGGEEQHD